MEQKRLFWAINLPVELKRKISDWQSWLRSVPVSVKWVDRQNLHLTLKFLGAVNADNIEALTKVAQKYVAGWGQIALELTGIGFFPHAKRPRVIWVGVQGDVQKLIHLQNQVEKSMAEIGYDYNHKKFFPHLTLGRIRSPRDAQPLVQKAMAMEEKVVSAGKMEVTTLDLVESKLTPAGPHYTVLSTLNLL